MKQLSEAEYETRVKEDEELEQCCAGEGGLREFLMGCLWSGDTQLMLIEAMVVKCCGVVNVAHACTDDGGGAGHPTLVEGIVAALPWRM